MPWSAASWISGSRLAQEMVGSRPMMDGRASRYSASAKMIRWERNGSGIGAEAEGRFRAHDLARMRVFLEICVPRYRYERKTGSGFGDIANARESDVSAGDHQPVGRRHIHDFLAGGDR